MVGRISPTHLPASLNQTRAANAPFVSHLALGNIAAPDTVYAHSNTKVYKSTNFATSWTAMTTSGIPGSYLIRNIGASRTSDAVGIAGNSGRVWLSTRQRRLDRFGLRCDGRRPQHRLRLVRHGERPDRLPHERGR